MPKNTTGPTLYTVNGRSVSKTILGKPYTGRYDGKLIIHWPPYKNSPKLYPNANKYVPGDTKKGK